jgi:hypothetical protein
MLHVQRKTDIDNTCYQGTSDKFLEQGQLLPENFLKAARAAGYDEAQVSIRCQEGYDHSYYFVRRIAYVLYDFELFHFVKVSTFAADHIRCMLLPSRDYCTLLILVSSPRWFSQGLDLRDEAFHRIHTIYRSNSDGNAKLL